MSRIPLFMGIAQMPWAARAERGSHAPRSIAGALALLMLFGGCTSSGRADRGPDQPTDDVPEPATSLPPQPDARALSPALQAQRANWEIFRTQARTAEWPRIDAWYRQFAAAAPRETPDRYRSYFEQSESDDPSTRANGYIGMAASNPRAALGALIRSLKREPDWNNRTILVWSLRLAAGEPGGSRSRRVTDALWAFIAEAPDADYGICLDAAGRTTVFRSPTPPASVEAFKGLVELRGRQAMLDGEGWTRVMDRLTRHSDTKALQLDPRWLESEQRPRETESETIERLMRELDGDPPG
jgi:hypothetical protein